MPEVLEAAHIKPFKYNGEDTIANGFPMRMDIHFIRKTVLCSLRGIRSDPQCR